MSFQSMFSAAVVAFGMLTCATYTGIQGSNISIAYQSVKPTLKIKKIHSTLNEIILQLLHDVSYLENSEYRIVYWSVQRNSPFELLEASLNHTTRVSDLATGECYFFVASMKILGEYNFTNSSLPPRIFCTKVPAPVNFTCIVSRENMYDTPAIINLEWKTLGKGIKYYRITISAKTTFVREKKINISSNKESGQSYHSYEEMYLSGGTVTYSVKACTEYICSSNHSVCTLQLEDYSSESPRSMMGLLFSILTPIVAILILVIAACLSYYRKKGLANDLVVEERSLTQRKRDKPGSIIVHTSEIKISVDHVSDSEYNSQCETNETINDCDERDECDERRNEGGGYLEIPNTDFLSADENVIDNRPKCGMCNQ